MPLWSDTFDRADGPVGPNWTVFYTTAAIASNSISSSNFATLLAGPVLAPGSAMAEAVVQVPNAVADSAWVCVKVGADAVSGYAGRAYNSGADLVLDLGRKSSASWQAVTTTTIVGGATASGTLRVTWASGVCLLYWNGTQYLTTNHSTYAANPRVGLHLASSSARVASFLASGDGSPQLIVSPRVVGTADGDQLLSLLGVAVAWTPGTPGSPVFSINAGALSSQQITSTTNASVLFSPPLTPGTYLIVDAPDGLSATITVVAGAYLGGGTGGAGGLPSAAVDWLTLQASHAGLILTDQDTTDGSVGGIYLKGAFGEILLGTKLAASPTPGFASTADAILTIWDILNGQLPHDSNVDVLQSAINLRADTTDLRARWATGNDGTEWTAHELVQLLGGEPIANHQDILTAIAGVGGGDDSAVLAAIAGAKGDPLATIKTVIDQLFVLSHLGAYDLGDVKDWAEAVRGSGLPTIKGVLEKLGGSGSTIEARIDALSDLIVTENTIQGMLNMAIAALAGGEGFTLAAVQDTVIDAINGLSLPAVSSSVRWPGLSAVTLGDPLALSDGLTIEGPMHGLLFEIIRSVPGGGSYEFGTVKSWSHVGGVIFCTDSGHYERSQSIGPEHQIVMPFTMETAESAILRLNGGFTGAVRTWTRT